MIEIVHISGKVFTGGMEGLKTYHEATAVWSSMRCLPKPWWTERCDIRKSEIGEILPDYMVREPTNLYPTPATVRINSGCLALTSSFWRRAAT